MSGSDKEHIVPSFLKMVVGFALMAQAQKFSPGHNNTTLKQHPRDIYTK